MIALNAMLGGATIALGCLVLVACKTQHPSGASGGDASGRTAGDGGLVDAMVAGTIGEAGGVALGDGDGARLTIPEGAVHTPHVYSITRVTGEALKDWPSGTDSGYVFEPAGKRFRIPATIELPHRDGEGEVMCVPYNGERMMVPFDATPAGKPFRFHVVELPRRCAVYSPDHARALKDAREKETGLIDKESRSYRWEMKGAICDPHQLVRPNAGKDIREPPGSSGCPAAMTPVPSHPHACIDRWEAHVVEVLEDGTEHTWSPYFNPGALRIRARSAPGAVPQGYVSQIQAGKACAEAGKRLCRDDEWVAACKGSKRTQFPYGNDEKRGTCNDHRDQHPAQQYLESTDLSVFTKLEHPCINQVPESLLPGGTKTQCATSEMAYDMVGNLHEWTADPAGTFRGGYYVETWLNGHGCDYVTTRHDAVYWDYSIGFRCCADLK